MALHKCTVLLLLLQQMSLAILLFVFFKYSRCNQFSFSKMTWCARIYDILNGWSEEENQFSITNNSEEDKPKVKQLSAEFYKDEIEDNNKTIIQHDSPFLEKSDSFPTTHLTTKQLYNDDYSNRYAKIFTLTKKRNLIGFYLFQVEIIKENIFVLIHIFHAISVTDNIITMPRIDLTA